MSQLPFVLSHAGRLSGQSGGASETCISHLAGNLRRLMAERGCTVADVVVGSGLDQRTVQAILSGHNRQPHAKTVHQLALAFEVAASELVLPPALVARRIFDRHTNPAVDQVAEEHPEWFEEWTPADFDELYSRFAHGGALTSEGVARMVDAMNVNRLVHAQVALLLETSEAEVLRAIVDVLYQRATTVPAELQEAMRSSPGEERG